MSAPSEYSLGPLPWKDEILVAAVWRNFRQAQEWVNEHPGRDLSERLDSLRAVQRIFDRSAKRFAEELVRFHEASRDGHLFCRKRRPDLDAFEEGFRELLYVFASSAMTLVDQARTLSQKVTLPGYSDRVDRAFASNPEHRFIQELRVDVIHVTLHRPGWQLTSGWAGESTSKFMLWLNQLSRASEYNLQARQFVRGHADGIDLGRLVADYAEKVRGFHDWLHEAVEVVVGDTIADYRRCTKRIKAVSSRSWWKIILQQVVISGKRDPYTYLDQYLTDEELAEVNLLPHRSHRQVDRIIELVDEYGACDEDLRKVVHRAFGASNA
ncbi:hypothetical protein [Trichloromonas sp.]|uniref:hypothetical protein n=1 Tax=Trichloromonas sp. TaxID=3069249 RepID=UPI002A421160|nr:hypothetical protein [Trichloromonas sp.]